MYEEMFLDVVVRPLLIGVASEEVFGRDMVIDFEVVGEGTGSVEHCE